MTKRTHTGLLLVALAAGLAACNGVSTPPTVLTPAQPPRPAPGQPAHAVADLTLSGVVYELTATGRVPIEGARVFLSDEQDIGTDPSGFFSFKPVWVCPCPYQPALAAGHTVIWVGKAGYADVAGLPSVPGFNQPGWRVVTIDGDTDTRFDVQLVRR